MLDASRIDGACGSVKEASPVLHCSLRPGRIRLCIANAFAGKFQGLELIVEWRPDLCSMRRLSKLIIEAWSRCSPREMRRSAIR